MWFLPESGRNHSDLSASIIHEFIRGESERTSPFFTEQSNGIFRYLDKRIYCPSKAKDKVKQKLSIFSWAWKGYLIRIRSNGNIQIVTGIRFLN